MKKVFAVLAAVAVCCFAAPAFAAHEVGNADQQPIVGGMVDVYGAAKLSVDLIDTDKEAPNDKSLTRVSSNSSRLGFKGAEDLGDGFWAVYQLELGITMDVNNAPSLRNTFIGLNSKSYGTLLAGLHDTPYKMSTGKLDIFGDTTGDYNAVIGSINDKTDFELRNSNVIHYQSPTWAGFHLLAATSKDGSEEVSTTEDKKCNSYAVVYSQGSLYATVAYEIHENGFKGSDTAGKSTTGTRLGAGYDFTATGTKLGLVYETIEDDNADSANSRNAMYASISQTFGKQTIKLAYATADDGDDPNTETGASMIAAGLDHKFTKRTTAYLLYGKLTNDTDAKYAIGNGGANAYKPAEDEDPSVISFGINHSF